MKTKKTKRPLANWTKAFPSQHKRLHPDRTATGGIKSRSQSEAVRIAVYNAIAEMFKREHPYCEACRLINGKDSGKFGMKTEDVHHTKSRDGLLLFDIRYFKAVCRPCHRYIHDNPATAIELGLTIK